MWLDIIAVTLSAIMLVVVILAMLFALADLLGTDTPRRSRPHLRLGNFSHRHAHRH